MKTVTAAHMREIDRIAIEQYNIPSIVLMENAGIAVARAAKEELDLSKIKKSKSKKIAIFCGSGNNGGDGFVAARHIYNHGYYPEVILVKPPKQLKGDALINYNIVEKQQIPIIEYTPSMKVSVQYSVIIDALLGTGAKGKITGIYKDAIDTINSLHSPVISVDIPSGLDSDTGKALGTAVKAKTTVTMGLVKKGLIAPNAKQFVGNLVIADIGLPPQLKRN